jgi:antitoxin CptB
MGVPLAMLPELGKLRWRCRRGMQELDILLSRYVEERFPNAPKCEQDAFQRLLETHDTVIYAYCLGQVKPPDEVATLIERITAGPAAGSQ